MGTERYLAWRPAFSSHLRADRLDLGDHLLRVRPAAAEHPLQHVAAAAGDQLTVDEHVELAELAVLPGDVDIESVLDVRGETRRAWAEASRVTVLDRDLHDGPCTGCRARECQ